jgi:hypothetical protein
MGRRDFSDDSHAGQCFVPERADSKPMAAPPPPLGPYRGRPSAWRGAPPAPMMRHTLGAVAPRRDRR